jgi:hypothetical protein
MSWGDIAAVVGAICAVAGLNLGGLRWLLDRRDKKQDAYAGRLDDIDSEIGGLDRRVIALETELKNAPGWDTINGLKGNATKIAEIEGEIKNLSTKIDSVKDEQGRQRGGIQRIEDHLLGSKS